MAHKCMTALVRSSSKVSFIGDVKVNPIIQRNVMPIGFRNFCFFSQNHSTKYQKSHSQYNNLFSFKTNSPITFQKRYSSFDLANHAKTEKITIKTFNTLRKLMTQYTSEGKLDKVWELSYKYIKLGDKHQSLYVRIFLAHFIETNQFINTLKMLDLLKEENLYPFQQGFTIKIINYIRLHVKEYQKIIPAHQKPIEQHKIKAQPKENYAMKLYDFVQIVISKNLVDLTACKLFNLLVRDFADCGLYEQANNMINLMKANDIHILDEYIKSPLLISYINNYKPSDKPEEKTILIPKTILEGRDQNCSYHPIYLLLSKDQEINNNNNNNNNSEESYEEENEENPILQKKKLLSEYKQEIMKNVKYNLKDNILNLKTKLFELGNQITINKDSNNEEQKLEEDDELNHQYQSLFTRLIIHYCLSKKDSDIQEISLYTKTQKIEISQISLDLLIGYNIINNQYDQLSEIMEFPNVNIDLMKRSIVSVIDYFIDQSMWKELNNLLSNLIKLNQITTGFFNLIISSVILPFHRHSLDRFIEIMNILNIQSDLQTLCIIVDTYLQSSEFQKVELLIAHLISDTVDALDVKSSNTEEKKPIIREKKELEKLKKECQAVNRLTLKLMEKYFVKYNYLEIINFFQNDILPYARELHISEYVISNVLLSMMKLGKFQDFPSFFTKLSESGIKFQQLKIYNLLFKEIIKNNRPDIGKELVMKFINSGTTPNEHTYGHIIKIYAQNDEVDKSVSILRNMEKNSGIPPTIISYQAFIDQLLKNNNDRFKELIEQTIDSVKNVHKFPLNINFYCNLVEKFIHEHKIKSATLMLFSIIKLKKENKIQLVPNFYHIIVNYLDCLHQKTGSDLISILEGLGLNSEQDYLAVVIEMWKNAKLFLLRDKMVKSLVMNKIMLSKESFKVFELQFPRQIASNNSKVKQFVKLFHK